MMKLKRDLNLIIHRLLSLSVKTAQTIVIDFLKCIIHTLCRNICIFSMLNEVKNHLLFRDVFSASEKSHFQVAS